MKALWLGWVARWGSGDCVCSDGANICTQRALVDETNTFREKKEEGEQGT
jgi:hypothetical protein